MNKKKWLSVSGNTFRDKFGNSFPYLRARIVSVQELWRKWVGDHYVFEKYTGESDCFPDYDLAYNITIEQDGKEYWHQINKEAYDIKMKPYFDMLERDGLEYQDVITKITVAREQAKVGYCNEYEFNFYRIWKNLSDEEMSDSFISLLGIDICKKLHARSQNKGISLGEYIKDILSREAMGDDQHETIL